MDGFSSAAAVVALTIQLAGTVQAMRKYLRDVRNAPAEICFLVNLLDQLHSSLNYIRDVFDLQDNIHHAPPVLSCVTCALRDCEKTVSAVEKIINESRAKLVRRHPLHKVWASMRAASKREDLKVVQEQLRDSIAALHMALSINSTHVQ